MQLGGLRTDVVWTYSNTPNIDGTWEGFALILTSTKPAEAQNYASSESRKGRQNWKYQSMTGRYRPTPLPNRPLNPLPPPPPSPQLFRGMPFPLVFMHKQRLNTFSRLDSKHAVADRSSGWTYRKASAAHGENESQEISHPWPTIAARHTTMGTVSYLWTFRNHTTAFNIGKLSIKKKHRLTFAYCHFDTLHNTLNGVEIGSEHVIFVRVGCHDVQFIKVVVRPDSNRIYADSRVAKLLSWSIHWIARFPIRQNQQHIGRACTRAFREQLRPRGGQPLASVGVLSGIFHVVDLL